MFKMNPHPPSETVFLLDQMIDSRISVNQIRSWTRKDPVLSNVLKYILCGWPTAHQLSPSDKVFYNRKLELSTEDGVILWGNCGHQDAAHYLRNYVHVSPQSSQGEVACPRVSLVAWIGCRYRNYVKNNCAVPYNQFHLPLLFNLGNGLLNRGPSYTWTLLGHS